MYKLKIKSFTASVSLFNSHSSYYFEKIISKKMDNIRLVDYVYTIFQKKEK